MWIKKTPPVACLVRVYRKGADYPFTASCRYDAYKQGGQMWSKFPETMLAKATTTLALRRGFADVIAGIASADEMDQAGLAAPEALTQGTPAQRPVAPSRPHPKKKAAAPEPVAAEVAAENLAKAMGGTVSEATEVEAPAPAAAPTKEDLMAVGLEVGLTTHAIEGILGIVGDTPEGIVKGIATIKKKDTAEIKKLNSKFEPKAETELEDW